MAKSIPPAESEAAHADEPKKKSGGKGKLLIGAFVSAIIVAETAIFFFMVPSGEDVAVLAESKLIQKVQAKSAEHHENDEEKVVEFDLGLYGNVFKPADADRRFNVEFKLFGTVLAKDSDRMQDIFREHKGRLRHRINLEIRNATLPELNESQLGLIQRRILATSIESLGVPILLSVGFEDYQVTEE